MKRSEINAIIAEGDAFFRSFGYRLPPFAHYSPEEMRRRVKSDSAAIASGNLGWDITDFGSGDFSGCGLFLFTVRNGSAEDLKNGRGMLYAEKIMIVRENQLTPMHHHIVKAEDIINRGGGTLVLELRNVAADGSVDEQTDVTVDVDGCKRRVGVGERLRLSPGESVTLLPHHWHAFWGEDGDVLVGEVSTVNDDRTDNIFRDSVGRFAEIEEDGQPARLLVSDYEKWLA
ncbi:D-lyxose/D-mannose family sugar isomerase [Sinorhizobium sp. BG8]|uniref:D-lyxose/D-mannose family sugar isomerase n=1 Tax=Sinorhizobium sp. BG8 TaxID=2613773 RepID=UPI00193D552E|nr:D-lyxose/D-mannose family sugar isomerase [Sinorhizobium sp. BG8]QRM55756.1 D-lyxose/D-mannose family sugar isomerase [Sinorhizobium sp. BG8]